MFMLDRMFFHVSRSNICFCHTSGRSFILYIHGVKYTLYMHEVYSDFFSSSEICLDQ
jgi:hypothetical protein